MGWCAPANTRHSANAVWILDHRLRRWPNIKTTLIQCLVFAGTVLGHITESFEFLFLLIIYKHWFSYPWCLISVCLYPTYPTNTRKWNNFGLMLVHRLRRWPNNKPTLAQFVSAEMCKGTTIKNPGGGGGVFGAGKLFISTWLGGGLKISHFITCLYRTVNKVNYLFHAESARNSLLKKPLFSCGWSSWFAE